MKRLLFIGIVGHAMRGLALAAKQAGNEVVGLDETADEGSGTKWLSGHGIAWQRDPDLQLLDGADAVIVSGGTPADYPLLLEARQKNIPVQSFAQYLGELTTGEQTIVVAGTHGKTTTTAFITWLLESAGLNPDFLIGVKPFNFETSARLAHGKIAVLEGDEYKASNLEDKSKFEYYHPDVLLLTSLEHDHPDMFPNLNAVKARFERLIKKLPESGKLVAWAESPAVLEAAQAAPCPVITYGSDTGDYTARDIAYLPAGIEFDIQHNGGVQGRLAIQLYGKHNVLNALGAVSVVLAQGLGIEQVIDGAATFKGTYRRFNVLSLPDAAITVVDDYAHHPTEVATNIEAARLHFPGRRIVAVFRPHTYSRTSALLTQYHQAFAGADLTYITDIEGARETGVEHTISGNHIVQGLSKPAVYIPNRAELVDRLMRDAKPGDVVLCFSVSGYEQLAEELATSLNKK
jgi:UDP-N-acetylmuramate--L-alanine ligase